jgi:hypothetical protein
MPTTAWIAAMAGSVMGDHAGASGVAGALEAIDGHLEIPQQVIDPTRLTVVSDDPMVQAAVELTLTYASFCVSGARTYDVLVGDKR